MKKTKKKTLKKVVSVEKVKDKKEVSVEKVKDSDKKQSETKILKKMIEILKMKDHHVGYFFIVNDVVHPVFCDEEFQAKTIKEAWEYVCKGWLNPLYGGNMSELLPYVIRGKVNETGITIGLNSPFYIQEVKKTFRIEKEVKIKVDKNLALSTKISKPTFKLLNMTLQQGIPYFDHLPWSIRIKFRENGTKEHRNEALYQIILKNENARKNLKS